MNTNQAQEIAIRALAYLAETPESLERFLDLSGLRPDQLRQIAGNNQFLGGILDFLSETDSSLLALCEHLRITPGDVTKARDALSGGPDVWDSI